MPTTPDYNQEELLDLLCGFFTGRSLAEIPSPERPEAKRVIVGLLYEYVLAELEEHHDPKDVLRLKQTVATGDPSLLDKFPESSSAFQQALLKMIDELG